MDQQARNASILARMDGMLEAIAKAICEGRLSVAEQRMLRGLTVQLAKEDTHPEKG